MTYRERSPLKSTRELLRWSRLATLSSCAGALIALMPLAAQGAVLQSGDIVTFDAGTDLRVGQTGSGQYTINGGSVVTLVPGILPQPEPFFVAGRLPGSNGQVTITEPGSRLELIGRGASGDSASAQVGREGVGSMTISNGGELRVIVPMTATPAADSLSPSIHIGRDPTSVGTLNVDAGKVNIEGNGAFMFVGRTGGDGTANFKNGSTLSLTNSFAHPDGVGITVGRDTNATGRLNVTDSTVQMLGNQGASTLYVGRETGAKGAVSFDNSFVGMGGTSQSIFIGRDAGTEGSLLLGNGSTVQFGVGSGYIAIGRSAGSSGEMEITGGSAVRMNQSSSGFVEVGGSYSGKTSAGSGRLLIDGTGSFLDVGADILGGTRRVVIGAAHSIGGVSSDGGHVTVRNGGRLQARTVHVGTNGLLDGNGRISADVLIEGGVLAPGNSPGTMRIDNGLTMNSGRIEIEIGGLEPGEFDVVEVLGGVLFNGGSIVFKFIDGFLAEAGDTVDFLRGASIAGLENVEFSYLGALDGFRFDVSSLGNALRFTALNDAMGSVPAPGALLLLALSLVGLAASRQMRQGADR